MYTLNHEAARAVIADRLADAEQRRLVRQARLTRPATRHPEPSARRTPGLLARLIPSFGARVLPA
jgi:hypothetical protein